ncbi:hypothetical protein CPAR01_00114 [Colletotrichum paranaense]|uniref:Uncharacterized protein n=1 Tax=Colletotrichum paranaense TaxID=1914294 RepID=A0ABQ9T2X6_9PEZI|nr:uncharacterized protein CPAR01_00114 [Colletotrichum paranaense]KAK1546147.1 hypothetical protein CPAR01_00114 [Colletotrichum paranaense]
MAIGGAPVVPVSYARVFQRHAKSRLWYPYTAYLHIRCCCEWLRGDDAALGHLALALFRDCVGTMNKCELRSPGFRLESHGAIVFPRKGSL